MTAPLVVAFCVALEGSRLCWHAHERGRAWLVGAHAVLAAALGGLLWPPLAPLAAISVIASACALDSKRRGGWLGTGLSVLSSWPWHAAGLASLGWWGLWLAPPTGWLAGLWWVSGLRPRIGCFLVGAK